MSYYILLFRISAVMFGIGYFDFLKTENFWNIFLYNSFLIPSKLNKQTEQVQKKVRTPT